MSARNKEQDFKALNKAAEQLIERLRADEAVPELYDQFQFRLDLQGCHRYFLEPYHSFWGGLVEHHKFLPFPPSVMEQCSKIECASFMGIFPEINRAWITVDNKLFLWEYSGGDACDVFDALSEVIVAVGLATPRRGVFLDNVKYVLVVATPVEVVVLAVTANDSSCSKLKMVPTAYRMPSDNVTMFKIVGSNSGRIFMAGNDGNLYEMDYSIEENSWASLVGAPPSSFKCRKVNHFAWNWRLVHLLPPFMRTITGGDDNLVDLAVDDIRRLLYSVTTRGVLTMFYLGKDGSECHFVVRAFNIIEQARTHLSGGRSVPESSPRAELFPRDSFSGLSSGFHIVSIHVLSLMESKKAHLLAILGNGIRIYLTVRAGGSDFSTGQIYTKLPNGADALGFAMPSSIEIAYVRNPPSNQVISRSKAPGQVMDEDMVNGSIPAYVPSQPLRVGSALYSHGTLLLTLDGTVDGAGANDEVVSIYEDLMCRSPATGAVGLAGQHSTSSAAVGAHMLPPCLKEGVGVLLSRSINTGKVYDIAEACARDVHNAEAASISRLFSHSGTPTPSALVRDQSHHKPPPASVSPKSGLNFPLAHSASAIASSVLHPGVGYDRECLDSVVHLDELVQQQKPSGTIGTLRQFLLLTNEGLHVAHKLRPVDILYRHLAEVSGEADSLIRYYFACFGAVHSSAMCIGLACALPSDAGALAGLNNGRNASVYTYDAMHGDGSMDPMVLPIASSIPLKTIQTRAMSVVLSLTEGPTYHIISSSNMIAAGGPPSLQDSRLVLNGSTHEFSRSPVHDGLYAVASRILRPVWLRGFLNSAKSLCTRTWSPYVLSAVRTPLQHLTTVLRDYFPLAVMSKPVKKDFMASLSNLPAESFVTRQMHAQGQQRAEAANPAKTLQQQARALEDASLSSLHRLVSRCVQALTLIETLVFAQKELKFPVDWKPFGDFSFRSLVVSTAAHEAVRKLLNGLLNRAAKVANKEHLSHQLLDRLQHSCYYFFSAGDRFAFEAANVIEAIKGVELSADSSKDFATSASMKKELSAKCVQLLLKASKYWLALDQVCDATSTVSAVASRARSAQSELSKNCSILMELGRIGHEGIVELCFCTAENFESEESNSLTVVASSASRGDVDAGVMSEFAAIDRNLYHGGSALDDSERSTAIQACYDCLVRFIVAVGASAPRLGEGFVVSNEATAAVHDPHLSARRSMAHMIELAIARAAKTSGFSKKRESGGLDVFHGMLFNRLFCDERDQLLNIRSQATEDFLREKDEHVLYKYYEQHGEHLKASALMCSMAQTEEDCPIEERVQYFLKSTASAERALAVVRGGGRGGAGSRGFTASGEYKGDLPRGVETSQEFLADTVKELKDNLEIAEYQYRAFERISEDYRHFKVVESQTAFTESQKRQLEALEHTVQRLHRKLLTITELFHEVCMPYKQWEICLVLLSASGMDDPTLIARLWRSVIYRSVPDWSDLEEANAFLRVKRDVSRIETDKRSQRSGASFEAGDAWLPALHLTVVQLGQQLLGGSESVVEALIGKDAASGALRMQGAGLHACPAFPTLLVLEELEELVAVLSSCTSSSSASSTPAVLVNRSFVPQCFYDIGFGYGPLLECYMELIDRWAGKAPEKLVQAVSSASSIMLRWTKAAMGQVRSLESAGQEMKQLMKAVRTGRLRGWSEKLRRQISTLSGRLITNAMTAGARGGAESAGASASGGHYGGADLLQGAERDLQEANRCIAELSVT